jgi:hypothetical protein
MKRLLLLSIVMVVFAVPSRAQSADASIGYSLFPPRRQVNRTASAVPCLQTHPFPVSSVGVYHASPSSVSLNTYFSFRSAHHHAQSTNILHLFSSSQVLGV